MIFDWTQDPNRAAELAARGLPFRHAPGRRADYRAWVGTRDQLLRMTAAAADASDEGEWDAPQDGPAVLQWQSEDSPLAVAQQVAEQHPGSLVLVWDTTPFLWLGQTHNRPGNPHHLLATPGTDGASRKLRLELLATWYTALAAAA